MLLVTQLELGICKQECSFSFAYINGFYTNEHILQRSLTTCFYAFRVFSWNESAQVLLLAKHLRFQVLNSEIIYIHFLKLNLVRTLLFEASKAA